MLAAIRARQFGREVTIVTDRLPEPADALRVECVPAQVVALLVEFGVEPRSVGARRLHEARRVDWSGDGPTQRPAALAAHLGRPALDLALLRLAEQAGVRLRSGRAAARTERDTAVEGEAVLDATGRRAATATLRVRPPKPIVARILHAPARNCRSELMVAAGRHGYAYRLADATTVVLGLVGGKNLVTGCTRTTIERVEEFAPWILEDLPVRELASGSAGAASVQWADSDDTAPHRIGDAALARDALASQGLAMGFGDALAAVGHSSTGVAQELRPPSEDAIRRHVRHVEQMIRESPFAHESSWRAYRRFLLSRAPPDLETRSSSRVGPGFAAYANVEGDAEDAYRDLSPSE